MKVSHCIDMMYAYTDFTSRIREAKKFGADAIEFWKWSNKSIEEIESSGVPVSIFNLDSRDEQLSYDLSRGILNDGRSEDFICALEESIPIYKRLGASAMIALIGEKAKANPENVASCLMKSVKLLEKEGISLVVEPLNAYDRDGYSMPYVNEVADIIRRVNSPRVKLLYDIYHQNMMGDFNLSWILENIDIIGHFHVADCPGRHEPGTGNVDYVTILSEINKSSFDGYIGLEYRATVPDGGTLGFLERVGEEGQL